MKPVLVFLTGTVLPQVTIRQMPSDVLVLDGMDVPGAFKRCPERLTPEMIEQVFQDLQEEHDLGLTERVTPRTARSAQDEAV